jgi:hypothetical protein
MSLTEIQSAMGAALLETVGHDVLNTPESWEKFTRSEHGKFLAGAPRERLYLYEELLFASVEDTLGSLYPYTKRFLEDEGWYPLVEQYRRSYPNRSYQLYRAAEHFPGFLSQQAHLLKKYPFLVDLAYYEWDEIEILNAPDEPRPPDFQLGFPDSVEGLSYWSPLSNPARRLRTFGYHVPELLEYLKTVETISPAKFKIAPKPSEILIYRDSEQLSARFFLLTPLTAKFIAKMVPGVTYYEIFQSLQVEEPALQAMPLEQILTQGLGLIQQCFQQNIILGSVPAASATP